MTDSEQRDALILAFQHLREHRSVISSLLAEVASLRDSLVEIGPRYAEILSRHRKQNVAGAKPLLSSDLDNIDEIIQRLREA